MQRALFAALLLGPLCGLMGVFVTARRMSFFSDTVSHGALTGIAVGLVLGMADPTVPMLLFSLAIALLILWLRRRTALLTDTIMAILMSASMAFGILLISTRKNYVGDLHRFLFGDILMIDPRDLVLAGALFVGGLLWLGLRLSSLALLTAQEELAHVCGISVSRLNFGFTILLTLTVALSIRLLGIVLVTSLLVIPAAAARNVSRNLRQHLAASMAAGLFGSLGGTMASYAFDLPCGPSIVMACVALFLGSLAFTEGGRPAGPSSGPQSR